MEELTLKMKKEAAAKRAVYMKARRGEAEKRILEKLAGKKGHVKTTPLKKQCFK